MVRGPALVPSAAAARSWFDALTDWIDVSPRSRMWIYAGIWLAMLALVVVPRVADARIADPRVLPFHVVLAGTAAYMMYLMHVTKRGFLAALTELEGSVDLGDAEFARLRERVTTTPAFGTLVVSAATAAVGTIVLLPVAQRPELGLFDSALASVAHGAVVVATTFVIGTYVCRAAFRMRWLARLYARHLRVDLLRPDPLFAQTGVFARGSSSLVLYTLLWVVTVPGGLSNVGFLSFAMFVNLLAVALYAIPLLRLHRLLADEKRRMLAEAYRQVRAASEALHDSVQTGALERMDLLSKGLAGLQTEIALFEKVSTWPWHPEVMRMTITAILVPVLVWSVQRMLQAWM